MRDRTPESLLNMRELHLAIVAASLAAATSASAALTFSGTALNGLYYAGSPQSDALYVAAIGSTPALAQLSTADAGLSGDAPAVFVQGPMGTLSSFSAQYSLYSSSGEAGNPPGNLPYWILWVNAPGDNNPNDEIAVIGMGGSTLNGSSPIHVYDPNNVVPSYWGDTLSTLDSITVTPGVTFGDTTVDWAGVEIGNWDNGTETIPASASFDSISVLVPEPTSMIVAALMLLPVGASTLRMLRKAQSAKR